MKYEGRSKQAHRLRLTYNSVPSSPIYSPKKHDASIMTKHHYSIISEQIVEKPLGPPRKTRLNSHVESIMSMSIRDWLPTRVTSSLGGEFATMHKTKTPGSHNSSRQIIHRASHLTKG